jgi:hypothetical protein
MIPLSRLTPADYRTYRPFFSNQRYPLCAYSLASIIAWTNDEYKPLGGMHRDAFIVAAEFETDTRNRHLLLPICPDHEFTPAQLAAIAEEAGHTQFWFVPESYVKRFGANAVSRYFTVQRHAAYDDYVYRVEDLAELKGNRYSKKRNLIKQFQRNVVDPGKVIVEPITPDSVDDCLIFLEAWCQERDCDADDQVDLACEKQAAINSLNHLVDFELKGIQLRIDGAVSAFGISAPLTGDMATLQYEKAFSSIKGLYQYFDNACARMLFDGYTYLNKESDMGIPGLAKAKKSYHPANMVRVIKLILNG